MAKNRGPIRTAVEDVVAPKRGPKPSESGCIYVSDSDLDMPLIAAERIGNAGADLFEK